VFAIGTDNQEWDNRKKFKFHIQLQQVECDAILHVRSIKRSYTVRRSVINLNLMIMYDM